MYHEGAIILLLQMICMVSILIVYDWICDLVNYVRGNKSDSQVCVCAAVMCQYCVNVAPACHEQCDRRGGKQHDCVREMKMLEKSIKVCAIHLCSYHHHHHLLLFLTPHLFLSLSFAPATRQQISERRASEESKLDLEASSTSGSVTYDVRRGRVPTAELLANEAELAKKNGAEKVKVLTSGPNSLVDGVLANSRSIDWKLFDTEAFSFEF